MCAVVFVRAHLLLSLTSLQPNCMAKYFTIGGERKIIMLTLREISVGEELTYDYKFARETDPNVLRIPCRCGSGEKLYDKPSPRVYIISCRLI